MSLDRNRDVLFPLVILVSVAVGAVIGGTLVRDKANTAVPVDVSAGDPKNLVDAIHELRTELVHIREGSGGLASPSAGSERADATAPPSGASKDLVAEMRKATAELTHAVDLLRDATKRWGGDRAPLIAPASPADPRVLDEVAAAPENARIKPYQLWTNQQVLDRFGPPDSIYCSDRSIQWSYVRTNGKGVHFIFVEGRVVQVTAN